MSREEKLESALGQIAIWARAKEVISSEPDLELAAALLKAILTGIADIAERALKR